MPSSCAAANDGARRVHRLALILTRRLTVGATGTVDRIDDGDELLLVRANLEHDFAVSEREEGEILPGADAVAGVELRATKSARTGQRAIETRETRDFRIIHRVRRPSRRRRASLDPAFDAFAETLNPRVARVASRPRLALSLARARRARTLFPR